MSTPGREDPAAHRNLATATRAAQESTATGDNAATLTVVPRLDHPGSLNPSNSTTPLGHDDHGDLDPAASLSNLPPELLDLVLSHVEPEHRTRTALSLAIATGHSPSQRAIWKHVVVNRGPQLMPLWKKLMLEKKKGRSGGCELARTFSQESWRGDADILNNVLRCLPRLQTILLNMGTNFAPEHLTELFEKPRDVQRIEMRFRPYVEQATYYQFLKGSYFDTAITTLYRLWPETPEFTKLSIVQDVPPRKTAPPTRDHSVVASLTGSMTDLRLDSTSVPGPSPLATAAAIAAAEADGDASDSEEGDSSTPPSSVDETETLEAKGYTRQGPFPYLGASLQHAKPTSFAQPIVFFDTECLARFGASPVAKHIDHLRLRIPSRTIVNVLVSPPHGPVLFPALRYLDLSTTNVRLDAVLAALLRNHTRLEHLVLDRVNLFGFTAREKGTELCRDLGGLCISAGLNRGKERERAIAAWDLAERTRLAEAEAALRRERAINNAHDGSEAARAAVAEEAMRDEMQRNIALARSRRGHRSAGHSTISLRDRPARRGGAAASTTISPADIPAADRAYFVLPPLPSLKTMSIGGEAPLISTFRVSTWEDQFHAGWRDGLSKLSGWAAHVADKYERAVKRSDEWKEWHARNSGDKDKTDAKGKTKGKAKALPADKARPPLDVRLYRFGTVDEPVAEHDRVDPTVGLIEVHPERARDYLDVYKDAVAEADMYTHSQAVRPPCVFCTVPDCEGPRRRGEEGARVDGRGGTGKAHKEGCGHHVGRQIWSWQGVES